MSSLWVYLMYLTPLKVPLFPISVLQLKPASKSNTGPIIVTPANNEAALLQVRCLRESHHADDGPFKAKG